MSYTDADILAESYRIGMADYGDCDYMYIESFPRSPQEITETVPLSPRVSRPPSQTQTTPEKNPQTRQEEDYPHLKDIVKVERLPIVLPEKILKIVGDYERTAPLTYGDLWTIMTQPEFHNELFLPKSSTPILRFGTHWMYPDGQLVMYPSHTNLQPKGISPNCRSLFKGKDKAKDEELFGKMVKEFIEAVKPPYGPKEWATVGYNIAKMKEIKDSSESVKRAQKSRKNRTKQPVSSGQILLEAFQGPTRKQLVNRVRQHSQQTINNLIRKWHSE